jgi:hypothetical protein
MMRLQATGFGERGPGQAIPLRPERDPREPREMKPPKQEGFHGKTLISFQEAQDLSSLLEVVLAPLTPQEAESELAGHECLRELNDAGGFPLVRRLLDRLRTFLASAQSSDTFQISHGEAVVTGKAVECAEALGRLKTLKTVATVGGVAAGGGALLLLLGLI